MRVVLVVSFRHSGSTVIGEILGSSPAALYVGESDFLPRHRPCSCGEPANHCPVLRAPDVDDPALARAVTRQSDPLRSARMWAAIARGRSTPTDATATAAELQQRLWSTPRPGVDVIVDSSKSLPLAALHAAAVEPPMIVWVRRDIRDAVNSAQRKGGTRKLADAGAARRTLSALADGARWVLTGWYMRRVIHPTVIVDYETLMAEPGTALPALAALLALTVTVDNGTVSIPDQHVVWANRRGDKHTVILRPPDQRREMLTAPVRWLLAAAGRLA